MSRSPKAVALEGRLKQCRNVVTLGVKTNFDDYSPVERKMIRDALKIYYPSTFYAEIFQSAGKSVFPSCPTYQFVQDKIKQTALFSLLKVPHPRTRVFYGKRQKRFIRDSFPYPFIAKIARGSAMGRGVFLISDDNDLEAYLEKAQPAYIQQYLPIDRDIRVVIVGERIVHAYWRIAPPSDFRCNVALGGTVSLEPVPEEALELALSVARSCDWNDVGIDICIHEGVMFVLEANMKYGKEGFRAAGMDYHRLMEEMIENGEI